ncbi:ubiquitin-like Rad60 SUMO-like protein [Ceratobasidium sp. AG-Ba]|nr:ubiquitin-like Rad60 SUMO-like protein [Ceratobasidium sp. AG-Ba]
MSSAESSASEPTEFIGAEYEGRKALIRRDSDYDTTVLAIRQAFKPLHHVSPHHITLSSFVQQLDDKFELPREIWAIHLPRINRVTVSVESCCVERKKIKRRSHKVVKVEPVYVLNKSALTPQPKTISVTGPGLGTVPAQPAIWPTGISNDSFSKHVASQLSPLLSDTIVTLRIHPTNLFHFKTPLRIVVEPSTTLDDLRSFIQSKVLRPNQFSILYYYRNRTIEGYQTVRDLELLSTADNIISIHILDF